MKTIVDASVVLDLLLGEGNKEAERFWSNLGNEELVAPDLLGYEIMNGLKCAVMQKRLDREEIQNGWVKFKRLDIELIVLADEVGVIKFALESNLSVYDASYVILAQKIGAELMTLDKKLKAKVKSG